MALSTTAVSIGRGTGENAWHAEDLLAVEEPLDLVLVVRARGALTRTARRLGLTMRGQCVACCPIGITVTEEASAIRTGDVGRVGLAAPCAPEERP